MNDNKIKPDVWKRMNLAPNNIMPSAQKVYAKKAQSEEKNEMAERVSDVSRASLEILPQDHVVDDSFWQNRIVRPITSALQRLYQIGIRIYDFLFMRDFHLPDEGKFTAFLGERWFTYINRGEDKTYPDIDSTASFFDYFKALVKAHNEDARPTDENLNNATRKSLEKDIMRQDYRVFDENGLLILNLEKVPAEYIKNPNIVDSRIESIVTQLKEHGLSDQQIMDVCLLLTQKLTLETKSHCDEYLAGNKKLLKEGAVASRTLVELHLKPNAAVSVDHYKNYTIMNVEDVENLSQMVRTHVKVDYPMDYYGTATFEGEITSFDELSWEVRYGKELEALTHFIQREIAKLADINPPTRDDVEKAYEKIEEALDYFEGRLSNKKSTASEFKKIKEAVSVSKECDLAYIGGNQEVPDSVGLLELALTPPNAGEDLAQSLVKFLEGTVQKEINSLKKTVNEIGNDYYHVDGDSLPVLKKKKAKLEKLLKGSDENFNKILDREARKSYETIEAEATLLSLVPLRQPDPFLKFRSELRLWKQIDLEGKRIEHGVETQTLKGTALAELAVEYRNLLNAIDELENARLADSI